MNLKSLFVMAVVALFGVAVYAQSEPTPKAPSCPKCPCKCEAKACDKPCAPKCTCDKPTKCEGTMCEKDPDVK